MGLYLIVLAFSWTVWNIATIANFYVQLVHVTTIYENNVQRADCVNVQLITILSALELFNPDNVFFYSQRMT